MCELFGVSGTAKKEINELLREFYSHSSEHPHGWGLALFYEGIAFIEKEPVRASSSQYLKERLRHKIIVREALAHIRFATKGRQEYENCHPFIRQDASGRRWTLVHNGTMFHCPVLDSYFYKQEGQTDSERILYYLIDRLDVKSAERGHVLSEQERFETVDSVLCEIAAGNKMNLLIHDGENLYVHSNYADSLFYLIEEGSAYFSTKPLRKGQWKPVPMTTVQVWKTGELVFSGTNHQCEYIDNPRDMESLFLDYSLL